MIVIYSFPVLPILQSFQVIKATNSSMTIQWELPQPPFLPIDEFIVSHILSNRDQSLILCIMPLGDLQLSCQLGESTW